MRFCSTRTPGTRRPVTRRVGALLATVVVATAAAGCGGGESTGTAASPAATTTPSAPASETGASPTSSPTGSSAGAALAADAAAAALAAVSGAVVEIGPGTENGQPVWEVLVRTKDGSAVDVYVSQATGAVVEQEPDDLPLEARSAAPAVTVADAITTAIRAKPGEVLEVELGTERGVVVWEIVVHDAAGSTEFYIDAARGSIVSREQAT